LWNTDSSPAAVNWLNPLALAGKAYEIADALLAHRQKAGV
jgi:hypothetical protein